MANILAWIYGFLALVSAFLMFSMGTLWLGFRKEKEPRPMPDIVARIVGGGSLHGAAGAGLWAYRFWDTVANNIFNLGSSPKIAVLILLGYAAAKMGILSAAGMSKQSQWVWNLFIGMAILLSALFWIGVAYL